MLIPDGVVLASSDLNAMARVLAAAGALPVTTTPAASFRAQLHATTLLIIDLDEGGGAALEELVKARSEGIGPARAVGFFSHVDRDTAKEARTAGCEAIPRGRFWARLPELLESV